MIAAPGIVWAGNLTGNSLFYLLKQTPNYLSLYECKHSLHNQSDCLIDSLIEAIISHPQSLSFYFFSTGIFMNDRTHLQKPAAEAQVQPPWAPDALLALIPLLTLK